jgi:N-acetylgalactosamine-6-sulfatase
MLEDMDRGVHQILETISDSGLNKRTIVVFASDHGGYPPARHAPFAGQKGGLFEGGIRAPCILRWPGHLKSGIVSDQTSITMDLTASFLRVAGAQPPANWQSDGIDVVRRIETQQPSTERALFWRARRGERTWRAVRDGSMKYVHRIDDGGSQQWLFDLAADPSEEASLLTSRSADAERLKQKLADWERDVRHRR